MLKFILCVTFVATAHAADFTSLYPHGPMFGGKSIKIEEVPYLITVCEQLNTTSVRVLCSGILIAKTQVLTTARCVSNSDGFPLFVRLKSSIREDTLAFPEITVDKIIIHEFFSVNQHGVPVNDLAFLKLKSNETRWQGKSTYSDLSHDSFSYAFLFDDFVDVSAGVDARTIGWDVSDLDSDEHLTIRTVPTLNTSFCDKVYESVGGVPAGQFCAAYPGAHGMDGCQGDSGAPLIIENRVAGILSWGNGCQKAHYPGVYIKLSYYARWINRLRRLYYEEYY